MRLNKHRAALILAEAEVLGDGPACAKHGVSDRTLRNYRRRLAEDPELAALFRERLGALGKRWEEELAPAILEAVSFLRKAAREANPKDPKAIEAVANALKVLAELDLTRMVLEARLEGDAPGLGVLN
ncbi:hypothetical protein [Thermus thermophilus]|uniref:Uncharacterized protein n=1 Tax=Thermus thermophilus TaxID=274 RepID=A0AAD1KTR9_THETH|nr:hypothetical protein [Thermus thermophilus]BCZ86923.1 hypothetical protein TthAA11_11050 [Thermus thermophilus]BCZ94475.1 hypothetical protein TthAK1_10920 [Thermus thermophilus]